MMTSPPLEPALDAEDLRLAIDAVAGQVAAAHRKSPDRLPHWVVFGPNTVDQPGLYCARLWFMLPQAKRTDILVRAGTLEELRELLPPEAVMMGPSVGDPPEMLEVWL